jgi:hypothetical protein
LLSDGHEQQDAGAHVHGCPLDAERWTPFTETHVLAIDARTYSISFLSESCGPPFVAS